MDSSIAVLRGARRVHVEYTREHARMSAFRIRLADWTCTMFNYASIRMMMTAFQSQRSKEDLVGLTKTMWDWMGTDRSSMGTDRSLMGKHTTKENIHFFSHSVCFLPFSIINHKKINTYIINLMVPRNYILCKTLLVNELMHNKRLYQRKYLQLTLCKFS